MGHNLNGVVRVRRSKLAAAAFLVIAAVGRGALALTSSWNTLNGNFNTAGNWTNGVPGSGDTAVFRRGTAVSYTVTFPGAGLRSDPIDFVSDQLHIGSNTVSFVDGTDFNHVVVPSTYTLDNTTTSESGRGIIIGETGSDTAAVLTTRLATLSSIAATIGDAADSNGTLNVSAGTFNISGSSSDHELIIGNGGTAALNIQNGADVNVSGTSGDSVIGSAVGSHGTATVTGSGSTWSAGNSLSVGANGAGTLNVNSSGMVSTSHALTIGSIGTVNLSGGTLQAESIANSGAFNFNSGTLKITGTSGLTIGAGGGFVNGLALGAASTLSVTNQLTINGATNVSAGGQIRSATGDIGKNSGANATLLIDGSNSKWTIGGKLSVGSSGGAGTLHLTNGAQLTTGDVSLGTSLATMPSNGTAMIDGAGTKWTIADGSFLSIGDDSAGSVSITGGGMVSGNAIVNVGGQGVPGFHDAVGALTIDGSGSALNLGAGTLIVGDGNDSTGTLSCTNGAQISTAEGHIGWHAGSNGFATIDGAGTQWSDMADIRIGEGGPGTLVISNGAMVSVGSSINQSLSVDAHGTLKGNGKVNGSVSNTGIVAPGVSLGPLTITNGNYTQTNGGTLQIEIGGTTAGSQYDQLLISGTATLNGTLAVSLTGNFLPGAGDSFNILDWSTLVGGFASLQLPALVGGVTWNTSQLYSTGTLSVDGVLGDYNHSGGVNSADYVLWRDTLGQSGAGLAADGNGNGTIDSGDFDVWRAHFGQSAGGAGVGMNTVVPEPTMALMIIVGALGMYSRRYMVG
jgi:T5SS/PEP-CTERM-associated repeat protein